MKNRVVIPTCVNRVVQPGTAPMALNKATKPGATNPLLEKRESTGAKAMVQRASATASVQQTLKPDAPSSAGKRAEKTGAGTAKLFEAAKGVGAGSTPAQQQTDAKSISPQKLAANRQNAKWSTGPRTERGKSHSRQNALKHGILVSALLITEGEAAENVAEFDKLLEDLRRDCKPKGKREELLVEEIAACEWKKMRGFRCEAGLIRRSYVIERAGPPPETRILGALADRQVADARDRELRVITDHLSVPLCKRLELLLRYEAANQKKEAFAITQLERLRLRRNGEHVPAPV